MYIYFILLRKNSGKRHNLFTFLLFNSEITQNCVLNKYMYNVQTQSNSIIHKNNNKKVTGRCLTTAEPWVKHVSGDSGGKVEGVLIISIVHPWSRPHLFPLLVLILLHLMEWAPLVCTFVCTCFTHSVALNY